GRIVRSFSQDLESVVFAVVAFLSGGVILFVGCFIVTKCFQFYKERVRRLADPVSSTITVSSKLAKLCSIMA
ncbi:unnamed protein product, partial [Heligmosomoides polygyrus]|uniref:Kit ligand n=1 Tax=Heligmosomoides polygyrus TaxID=6339 RepID=A0A183FJ79_HELPZ